jgi:transcriptional regulator with XRE-family HTH domain
MRALRKQAKIKVTDMAHKIGVSHQQLMNYEQGRTRITETIILRVAAVFDVPPARLFE